jgi:dihydroxyacetone kinase-like protein
MRTENLIGWMLAASERLVLSRDELTELDAAAGDGDLGVTVAAGAAGVATALGQLPPASSAAEILRAAGAAFARGNPSSFAALGGAGLLAAARQVDGAETLDRKGLVAALQAAADRIAERGRATLGERTVLDALVPSIEALRDAPPGAVEGLRAMLTAARDGVDATTRMTPTRGRAAWVGERGRGIADGGATAYLRFLEALMETIPAVTG